MYVFFQYFDTDGWVFWSLKIVARISYTVLSETLNHALPTLPSHIPLLSLSFFPFPPPFPHHHSDPSFLSLFLSSFPYTLHHSTVLSDEPFQWENKFQSHASFQGQFRHDQDFKGS